MQQYPIRVIGIVFPWIITHIALSRQAKNKTHTQQFRTTICNVSLNIRTRTGAEVRDNIFWGGVQFKA